VTAGKDCLSDLLGLASLQAECVVATTRLKSRCNQKGSDRVFLECEEPFQVFWGLMGTLSQNSLSKRFDSQGER
jgi:hypothetical protein